MEKMVIGKQNEDRGLFKRCVMNGAGWRELHTPEEFALLKEINNESRGSKHVPMQHWDAINMFNDALASNNVVVKNDMGMLSQNLQKFVYTAEVTDSEQPDLSFFLGFLSFNDKTRALTTLCGRTVFCCSNGMIKLDQNAEKRKHLKGIESESQGIFSRAVDNFNRYRDEQMRRIGQMKQIEVDDRMLADIVLDMHKSNVFSHDPFFIGNVVKEFVAEVPRHVEFSNRSLWSCENALTEQYKKVSPIGQAKYAEAFNQIIDKYID